MSPGLGETPTLTQISEYASKIMAPTRDNRDDLPIFRASCVERDASFGARRRARRADKSRFTHRQGRRAERPRVSRHPIRGGPPRARCAGRPLSRSPAGARHATRDALGPRARDLQVLDSSGVSDTIWPFCVASQRRFLGSSRGERLGSKRRANSCSLSWAPPSTFANTGRYKPHAEALSRW